MTVPFIRVLPNGTKVGASIARAAETESLAARFISLGGRYLAEIQTDGKVKLSATIPHKGARLEVEALTQTNGPELPSAIDKLIQLSDLHVQELWIGDEGDLRPMAEA